MKELEVMVESLVGEVFVTVSNFFEGLDVLQNLYQYSKSKGLALEFENRTTYVSMHTTVDEVAWKFSKLIPHSGLRICIFAMNMTLYNTLTIVNLLVSNTHTRRSLTLTHINA